MSTSAHSSYVNARSCARISASEVRTRRTCSGSTGSERAARIRRTVEGRCSRTKPSCSRVARERISWTSSITNVTVSGNSASVFTSSGANSGAPLRGTLTASSVGPANGAHTRRLSTTARQRRNGSSSPGSSDSQPTGVVACCAHSASKLVLPEPAGPQTRVTGADPSRSTRRGRAMNGPRCRGTRTWVPISGGYAGDVPLLPSARAIATTIPRPGRGGKGAHTRMDARARTRPDATRRGDGTVSST